jgi:hypothetical protein
LWGVRAVLAVTKRRIPGEQSWGDANQFGLLYLTDCGCLSFCIALRPQMRLAVIALAIIVMASAIAMAFNYAQQPSYAAPSHAKRNVDANGNAVVRNR